MKTKLNRRRLLELSAATAVAMPALAKSRPSSKKGFGVSLRKSPDWSARLQALDARWFYTWGSSIAEGIPPGMEYVPMTWSKGGCSAEVLNKIVSENHSTLLGFNEPDHYKQANMTVDEALALWPALMETGLRLGSPAAVHPDGEWMTAFMKEADARGYRVDFITMHSYMGGNPKHFLQYVEKIQKLYRKPIWITEFAVADWNANADLPNKYTPNDVYKFMKAVLPALEKRDYVERYAWFSAPKPSLALKPSALFNSDGSLNKLGNLYASF